MEKAKTKRQDEGFHVCLSCEPKKGVQTRLKAIMLKAA